MPTIAIRAVAVIVTALAAPILAADDDFKPLVKGDDPLQFELVKIGPDTIKIVDGEVRISGQPNGYFATKGSYRNYVLSFDWKYDRPERLESDAKFEGNSGVLIHIQPPHKVWPQCIEAQLYNKDAGRTFAINGSKFDGKPDPAAQKRAIKPVGEWNEEEITCKDGSITCKINGIEVCRGTGASPDRGSIGWQSEGAPIRFRKLRIKVLD
jgi:hypothetical protein